MTDDIAATFTTEELGLLKEALDRLHFFSGELVREQAWELMLKVNTLLPKPGLSF
jgi:hypothetical protein